MAVRDIEYDSRVFSISYEILNPSAKKEMTILHGWGSNKEIMRQAFATKLSKDIKQIYIDLPGFGKSSNGYILSSSDYVEIIELFLNSIKVKKHIILGHSFGGKIGVRLDPKLLILVSSAGIVKKKSFKVRAKIKLFKLLKPFAPKNLYKIFATKDAENMPKFMYETLKNVVDEDYSNYFKNYSGISLIFWGKDDKDTPLSSGKKISKFIKNSYFYEYNGDHFFFLKESKDIVEKIENFV